MSYITNITLLMKHCDWSINDKLLTMTYEDDGEDRLVGFRRVEDHAGGKCIYVGYIWVTAADYLPETYKDQLFNVLKGNADDVYLYEQAEDNIARIYYMDTFGWKHLPID